MEDLRVAYIRVFVESYLVESIVRCLEGIEVESLTVRSVHEWNDRPHGIRCGRFEAASLTLMEVYASAENLDAIRGRIHGLRKPIDVELACRIAGMFESRPNQAQETRAYATEEMVAATGTIRVICTSPDTRVNDAKVW